MSEKIKYSFIGNVTEVQLGYKNKIPISERIKISNSAEACDVLRQNWDPNLIGYIEEFKFLLLDRGNNVLGFMTLSKGGISGTIADLRIIFQAALKVNASALIICHNHPSGNKQPSEADIKIAKKIKDAGELLDIHVIDCLIITETSYFSFGDENII